MTFEVGMFGTKLHLVSKNPNVCIHTLENIAVCTSICTERLLQNIFLVKFINICMEMQFGTKKADLIWNRGIT